MATMAVRHLSFLFLLMLIFLLEIDASPVDEIITRKVIGKHRADEPPKTFEDSKLPFYKPPGWGHPHPPERPFEESKPPRAVQPVKGPLKPPENTFEESKPAHVEQPAKGPLEAPENAFEESKPPHIEHPVKGPPKPPGKTYEEEKPPIALHRAKHAATATLPRRLPPGHDAQSDEQATQQTQTTAASSFGDDIKN
ncbi:hypothetical protein Nepgr_031888 [Nepenthes gracilis]|uniref:Uncharacterized protein n=1 Tax=Nepenthes gracilis TaxID=150966 RepID=A0AAD3Y788_NEPGR|nr:hypothetical protein Nepgr_031888 [Nepenthes gracilis]